MAASIAFLFLPFGVISRNMHSETVRIFYTRSSTGNQTKTLGGPRMRIRIIHLLSRASLQRYTAESDLSHKLCPGAHQQPPKSTIHLVRERAEIRYLEPILSVKGSCVSHHLTPVKKASTSKTFFIPAADWRVKHIEQPSLVLVAILPSSH